MTTSVEVPEGSTGIVPDLVFTPVGTVRGRVTLAGASSENAGTVVWVDGSDAMAATDEQGSYSLTAVPIGTHTLQATRDGYVSASVETPSVSYRTNTQVADIALQPHPSPATPLGQ